MSDSAADSLYGSDVRVLQHILFGARNAPPPVKAATRKKAEAALARVRKGGRLRPAGLGAVRGSGQQGRQRLSAAGPQGPVRGRVRQRRLGAPAGADQRRRRDAVRLPPDPAAAARRGPRAAGRLPAGAGRQPRWTRPIMDSLAKANNIEVKQDAAATMRAALRRHRGVARAPRTVITSYKGGELTVREYLRWVRALPPQYLHQLKAANDSTLQRFARVLTQNMLLLREADAAGIQPTELEWKTMERALSLAARHAQDRDGARRRDLKRQHRGPGGAREGGRPKMEQYFDNLIAGKVDAPAVALGAGLAPAGAVRATGSTRLGSPARWSSRRQMKAKADSAQGAAVRCAARPAARRFRVLARCPALPRRRARPGRPRPPRAAPCERRPRRTAPRGRRSRPWPRAAEGVQR